MKKTIKKDMERITISQTFINDNTLLESIVDEDEKVSIVVRFVESPTNGIKEHTLARVGVDAYHDYVDNFMKINEERDTIALFVPVEGRLQLDRLYDTTKHRFASEEFMDLVYKEKFKSNVKQFVKEQKK